MIDATAYLLLPDGASILPRLTFRDHGYDELATWGRAVRRAMRAQWSDGKRYAVARPEPDDVAGLRAAVLAAIRDGVLILGADAPRNLHDVAAAAFPVCHVDGCDRHGAHRCASCDASVCDEHSSFSATADERFCALTDDAYRLGRTITLCPKGK